MAPPACLRLGLLLCLVMGPFLNSAAECPSQWLSYNNHCYRYFPQELTWRQAQAHCQRFKGNLASILDAKEHHTMADFLHQVRHDDEDVWIGLSISTWGQGWKWADNSAVTYLAWDVGKPSPFAKNEHCAQMDEDSGYTTWDSESCNDRNPFLCKL